MLLLFHEYLSYFISLYHLFIVIVGLGIIYDLYSMLIDDAIYWVTWTEDITHQAMPKVAPAKR
jgi:hypothetical protein